MKHFLKETGKYLYDLSKIVLAVAVITPMFSEKLISYFPLYVASGLFLLGAILIYQGGKDDT